MEHLCHTIITVVIFKFMYAVNVFCKTQSGVRGGSSRMECERVFETGMLHSTAGVLISADGTGAGTGITFD